MILLVAAPGLEPGLLYRRQILSLLCLPFHHAAMRVPTATGRQVESLGGGKLRRIYMLAHRILPKVRTLLGPMR